jgi:hypothetical protein
VPKSHRRGTAVRFRNGTYRPARNQMCSDSLRGVRTPDRRCRSYPGAGGTFHTPQCGRRAAHSKSSYANHVSTLIPVSVGIPLVCQVDADSARRLQTRINAALGLMCWKGTPFQPRLANKLMLTCLIDTMSASRSGMPCLCWPRKAAFARLAAFTSFDFMAGRFAKHSLCSGYGWEATCCV